MCVTSDCYSLPAVIRADRPRAMLVSFLIRPLPEPRDDRLEMRRNAD
jgi:hypothetical protein